MTVKESILFALQKIGKPANYKDIYKYIADNKIYEFSTKTPPATISATLHDFIKKGDSRIKRKINTNGANEFYLSDNEIISEEKIIETIKISDEKSSYKERDLHKLFVTYLRNQKINAKTIYHEKSEHGKDKNLKWVHPDIVGVKFSNLCTKEAKHLLETSDKMDSFTLMSYELKCKIISDYDLKQYFFQAVSNSSWANYGYLVTFDYDDELKEEMERLSQSFGIGIIHLKVNPFESKVLFPAAYHKLDFKTIDKLCKANSDFSAFIEQVEKYISVEEKYSDAQKKVLEEICDEYFENDSDIELYCAEKGIKEE